MSSVDDVIREMEAVEWRDVPTISTLEASVFTQRLIEAREARQEREVARYGAYAFLGATAALTALPASVEARGDGALAEKLVEDYRETDDGGYQDVNCGDVQGSLNHAEIAADMNDGPVSVSGVREEDGWVGVGLQWTSGALSVGAGLDPADARELADRLRVAAAFADGEFDTEDFGGEGDGA